MPKDITNLPFEEQVKFLVSKLDVPTKKWNDILNSAHNKAFVVAGVTNSEMLNDIHKIINDIVKSGKYTFIEFQGKFWEIVNLFGWTGKGANSAWRANLIFNTNLRTSYAAGRYKQLEEIKSLNKYWMYLHSHDSLEPRPVHLKWDKMVLPANHNWWKTHFPPNGYGCNCQVFSLAEDDLKRKGLFVTQDSAIYPGEADIGWGYTPGKQDNSDPGDTRLNPVIAKNKKEFISKNKK